MTDTNYQLPRWLNPECAPSAELRARMTAATNELAAIARRVDDFVATHRQTVTECHAVSNGLPDGVWQIVDVVSGYDRLHADMHSLADRLEDLADGKLSGIGDDVAAPEGGF